MSKDSKKVRASLKLSSIYPLNGYTIIPSTGTEGGETVVGTRFHGAVSLLIAECVD